MYTGYYFMELIVKERQRQLVAEADRLRQTKAIKSKTRHGRKRRFYSITDYFRILGASFFRKNEGLTCRC